MLGPLLEMMDMKLYVSMYAAILASVIVSFQNRFSPTCIFYSCLKPFPELAALFRRPTLPIHTQFSASSRSWLSSLGEMSFSLTFFAEICKRMASPCLSRFWVCLYHPATSACATAKEGSATATFRLSPQWNSTLFAYVASIANLLIWRCYHKLVPTTNAYIPTLLVAHPTPVFTKNLNIAISRPPHAETFVAAKSPIFSVWSTDNFRPASLARAMLSLCKSIALLRTIRTVIVRTILTALRTPHTFNAKLSIPRLCLEGTRAFLAGFCQSFLAQYSINPVLDQGRA
jgi:hypothetical protein